MTRAIDYLIAMGTNRWTLGATIIGVTLLCASPEAQQGTTGVSGFPDTTTIIGRDRRA